MSTLFLSVDDLHRGMAKHGLKSRDAASPRNRSFCTATRVNGGSCVFSAWWKSEELISKSKCRELVKMVSVNAVHDRVEVGASGDACGRGHLQRARR